MTIQDFKQVYTAGLEAIIENGADEVRKHNRSRDVNLTMERGSYCVSFCAPVNFEFGDGSHLNNAISIEVVKWHNEDLCECGTLHFEDTKSATRFLRQAIRDPKRAMKKMDTYFED